MSPVGEIRQGTSRLDAVELLAYSLLVPASAHRFLDTFPVLKTEPGRVAQIIVITELQQSASRELSRTYVRSQS